MYRKSWVVSHLALCSIALILGFREIVAAEPTDADLLAETKRTLVGLRESFRKDRIAECMTPTQITRCLGLESTASDADKVAAFEKAEKSGETLCTGMSSTSPACRDYLDFLRPLEGALLFAEALAKDVAERSRITPSLRVGFSRDDVPEDDQPTKDVTKITSAIKLDADSYPDDFHAEWSTDVRYSAGQLTEELTKAHVNVDHYVNDRVQAFGYVDRGSDSFMSIDQRYEVGFGADWEYFQSGRRTQWFLIEYCSPGEFKKLDLGLVKKGKEALKGFTMMCENGLLAIKNGPKQQSQDSQLEAQILSLDQAHLGATLQERAKRELTAAAKELLRVALSRKYFPYIAHKYSHWEVSTSAAISYDSTQYSIKTSDSVSGNATTISGATSLNRWSIRQSIRYRLDDQIEVRLMWFWKPAFGARAPQFEDDYRQEAVFYIQYTGQERVIAWKPKMRFEVDFYQHNNPPTTADLLNGQPSTAITEPAVGRHIVSRLTIGLEF